MAVNEEQSHGDSPKQLWQFLIPILIFTTVITVRGGHVDTHGLWEDEAVRYYRALGNNGALVAVDQYFSEPVALSEEWHEPRSLAATSRSLRDGSNSMPAHSYLVNLTARLIGHRKYALLKSWNVLFSLITAIVMWLWASRSLGLPGGVLAVTGFVLSVWDMAVTLQLKEYALAAACVTGSSWLLWEVLHNKKGRIAIAGYGIFAGLGLATHMHVWMMVALQGAYVIATTRFRGSNWRSLTTAGILSALPLGIWLLFAGRQQFVVLRQSDASFGDPYGGFQAALARLGPLLRTLVAPVGDSFAPIAATSMVLLAAFMGLTIAKSTAGRLSGILFFGAIGCSFLYHITTHDGHALWPRYFEMAIPCMWIAAAAGLTWLITKLPSPKTQRAAWTAGFLLVVLFGASQVQGYRSQSPPLDSYADWRKNAELLEGHIGEYDLIVHSPGGGAFAAFSLYWNLPNPHMGWDGRTPLPGSAISSAAENRPIWLILTWGRQELQNEAKTQMSAAGFRLTDEVLFEGGIALCWSPMDIEGPNSLNRPTE